MILLPPAFSPIRQAMMPRGVRSFNQYSDTSPLGNTLVNNIVKRRLEPPCNDNDVIPEKDELEICAS